jgi:hypothetical protein
MRFVILNYHIFKNAGMSLEEILDRNFGERFTRFDAPDRNARVDNAVLLDFLDRNGHLEAVSSHQIRYPIPAVPGFLFFDVCFLRDPLDRIRSMYDYARVKPLEGDPLSEMAVSLELRSFIERVLSDMPDWICDMQSAFLAGEENPRDVQLQRATRTMLQASFVGVVDRFAESIAAGEYFLRPVFAGFRSASAEVNVSKGLEGTVEERKRRLRDVCGERLYTELVRRNELDLELVERARVEVDRRFKVASGRRFDSPNTPTPGAHTRG